MEQAITSVEPSPVLEVALMEAEPSEILTEQTQTRWTGLKLRLRQGLEVAGYTWCNLYMELSQRFGQAIGVVQGEPFMNPYSNDWAIHVSFRCSGIFLGCQSVPCQWVEAIASPAAGIASTHSQ